MSTTDDRRLFRKLELTERVIAGLLDLKQQTPILEKKLSEFDELILDISDNSLVREWTEKSIHFWKEYARLGLSNSVSADNNIKSIDPYHQDSQTEKMNSSNNRFSFLAKLSSNSSSSFRATPFSSIFESQPIMANSGSNSKINTFASLYNQQKPQGSDRLSFDTASISMSESIQPDSSDSQIFCGRCRVSDHRTRDCPVIKSTKCLKCGQTGHTVKYCLDDDTRATILTRLQTEIFDQFKQLVCRDRVHSWWKLLNLVKECNVTVGKYWADPQLQKAIFDFALPKLPEDKRQEFMDKQKDAEVNEKLALLFQFIKDQAVAMQRDQQNDGL